MVNNPEADEVVYTLDPSTLLLVIDALVGRTCGVGIDPKSGLLMRARCHDARLCSLSNPPAAALPRLRMAPRSDNPSTI